MHRKKLFFHPIPKVLKNDSDLFLGMVSEWVSEIVTFWKGSFNFNVTKTPNFGSKSGHGLFESPGWFSVFFQEAISCWWLNQPIWKICSSKWVHLPQVSGWKFQTIIELPPPSHLVFSVFQPRLLWKNRWQCHAWQITGGKIGPNPTNSRRVFSVVSCYSKPQMKRDVAFGK